MMVGSIICYWLHLASGIRDGNRHAQDVVVIAKTTSGYNGYRFWVFSNHKCPYVFQDELVVQL